MAVKQYYCIDYRNMHKGIHGLIIFNTRKEAEDSYIVLKNGIAEFEKATREGRLSEEEGTFRYECLVQDIFDDAMTVWEEIDYHVFEEGMLRGRLEKYIRANGTKYIVVNNRCCIDLYI